MTQELKDRIAALEKALAYAIEEADGWHDDSRGGPIMTDEMNEAKALIGIPEVKPREMTPEEMNELKESIFGKTRVGQTIKFRRYLPHGNGDSGITTGFAPDPVEGLYFVDSKTDPKGGDK